MITKNKDVKGFEKSKRAAIAGGDVAGKARQDLERKSGKKVSIKDNYLNNPQDKKLLGE